jgi:hypothetical protein
MPEGGALKDALREMSYFRRRHCTPSTIQQPPPLPPRHAATFRHSLLSSLLQAIKR